MGAIKTQLLELAEGLAHWQMAKLLMGWLVCAKRPLKWYEMQAILSYDPANQKVDFDNKMLRQNAKRYLGSLVQILDGGHIRIIHSTARRYDASLTANVRLGNPRLTVADTSSETSISTSKKFNANSQYSASDTYVFLARRVAMKNGSVEIKPSMAGSRSKTTLAPSGIAT